MSTTTRANPFLLTVPKRKIETRTFADPDHPGTEYTFTLGSRNFVVMAKAQAAQAELIEKWVSEEEHEQPAFPVPREEGEEAVYVDEVMCQAAATAWAMQAGEEGYSADEMLAIELTSPAVFEALIGWVAELSGAAGGGGPGGNGSRAVTASSSAPPLPEVTSIPSSAITSAMPSGASTSGSRTRPLPD